MPLSGNYHLKIMTQPSNTNNNTNPIPRVPHGYGFTRGASKTGTAGTGTVLDFGTPRHTAYPYRGVTGIHGFYGMAEVSKGEP
jgi:hypothetical protein